MDGTVVNGKEDGEEKLLCLFGNSISVDILYVFLDYGLLSGTDDIEEGCFMQPPGLAVWIVTVLIRLEQ